MPNAEKVKQVADLTELFQQAPAIAITDYAGLTVEKITLLRKELRETKIKYLVAKNTLLRLAVKGAGVDALLDFLHGPIAVAFGTDDPGRMAKILYDFGKRNEKPEIKALFVDDIIYTDADVERIAKLPSKEVLQAMVIGNIVSPIQNFVGTLDGVVRDLVLTIDAIKEKIDK